MPRIYQHCKETGRIDAFLLDWKPGKEPKLHYFWDSDVAKWVEAASYSLATHPDPKLGELLDEVVGKITSAQQPDGYLNIYFTVVEPEKRWKNLGMWHELYCAGHLMEAAVAHYQATGKRTLLDTMCRYADYIDSVFGPGKRDGCPGHQEIELALVRLYRVTGERRYLNLSRFFLGQRGQKPSFFEGEVAQLSDEDAAINRHFFIKQNGSFDSSYCQNHLPVREQSEVVGHAVRAMYMYTAMADVGVETGDEELLAACQRLWGNVCRKRMYVTGGIGSSRSNEGFSGDYDLPNKTAYAETCAAVGLIFWNHRLLQVYGDGRYDDVMERALYNGAISGISLDGTKFFYVNPLESTGNHHRQEWFGCACCPPNIARLLASLGQYIYSEGPQEAYVHLYISGSADLRLAGQKVALRQQSDYPWDGRISLEVQPEETKEFGVNLRIPGWCPGFSVEVNRRPIDSEGQVQRGYLRLKRRWQPGDTVELNLEMPVQRMHAHPRVPQTAGKIALQRGPIVYCLEEMDNCSGLHRIAIPDGAEIRHSYDSRLLGGIVTLTAPAVVLDDCDWNEDLYRPKAPQEKLTEITAVPYYAWDHREPGEMRVWIRSRP